MREALKFIYASLTYIRKNWDTFTDEEKTEFLHMIDAIAKITPQSV